MTNIAFTTLVILVLAVPGFIFRSSYYSGTFTRQILPRNLTDDIARGILWSLPFHFVGILAADWLQHRDYIKTALNFETAARIVSGIYANSADGFSAIIYRLYHSALYISAYYLLVLIAAFGFGHALRLLVWNLKLDVRFPLLQFRNPWLYTLTGRDVPPPFPGSKIYVQVDALTNLPAEFPGRTILYQGIVEAFTTEENGSLRDLILKDAKRGKFKQEQGKEPEFYLKAIEPGKLLVLKYSDITNMNITYLASVPLAAQTQVDTA